jgi:hypothetical protein
MAAAEARSATAEAPATFGTLILNFLSPPADGVINRE